LIGLGWGKGGVWGGGEVLTTARGRLCGFSGRVGGRAPFGGCASARVANPKP
jgi:hypothetical protein